jgi:hypothetical protein
MTGRAILRWAAAMALGLAWAAGPARGAYIEEEFEGARPTVRPPPPPIVEPTPPPIIVPPAYPHVPEVARYLARLDVGSPVSYGHLVVYPLRMRGGDLGGRWLTMDQAMARGVLTVHEKGEGAVPTAVMQNHSRTEHVFIMAGELLSGGKQGRAIGQDVVLAPGQRVDTGVLCVEQNRWRGEDRFSAGGHLVPQSIQRELRKGAGQDAVWSEVARSNRALGAESPTGSLEAGLRAPAVQDELVKVRRWVCPRIPGETAGFVFARCGEALGAECFGRADLAAALLPKLLDAYAVEVVVPHTGAGRARPEWPPGTAEALLERVRRAGSSRCPTLGSGAGIRTRALGLVGDGVSLGDDLVHFGCQVESYAVPMPRPMPAPRPHPWRENPSWR